MADITVGMFTIPGTNKMVPMRLVDVSAAQDGSEYAIAMADSSVSGGSPGGTLLEEAEFTADDQSEEFSFYGSATLFIYGGGSGTVQLQQLAPDGTSWVNAGRDGSGLFTADADGCAEVITSTGSGQPYRLDVDWVSGTITVAVVQ